MRYYLLSDTSSEPDWHECEDFESLQVQEQETLSYVLFDRAHQLILWNPLLWVISVQWPERIVLLFSVTGTGAQVIFRQVTRAQTVFTPFIPRRSWSRLLLD
jgi:hypothetical protein